MLKLVLDLIKSIKNQSNPIPEPRKEWSQMPQKGMFTLWLQRLGAQRQHYTPGHVLS